MPVRKEVAAGVLAVVGIVVSVAVGYLIASLLTLDVPEYTANTQVTKSAPERTQIATRAPSTATASVSTTAAIVAQAGSPSPTWTFAPTRIVTGTATQTPTPASPDTPSVTLTATPADTPTAAPILTATPTPALQSPPSPSPSPTFANTPLPPTPTPVAYEPPTLVAPEDGASRTVPFELRWSWNGTLDSDEYFDVRVWEAGEPHNGIAWTKTPQITLSDSVRPGTVFWTVAVIRGEDGQWREDLSPEAPARELTIYRSGTDPEPEPTTADPDPTAAGPDPTPTR